MKRKSAAATELIPTSSMADVAFLLIIFFMLLTNLVLARGLDYTMPEDDVHVDVIEPEDAVLVEVGPDGSLEVDRRPMLLDDLLGYLHPKLEANATKPVLLATAEQAPFGAMLAVYDELRRGKKELGLEEEIQVSIPTRRDIELYWP